MTLETEDHSPKKASHRPLPRGGRHPGAMYEVGVLAALEDSFEGFRASDFDVIIGASTGACVATALAGGISAQRMYRALLDPSDDFFPLKRQHMMRIDLREMRRVCRVRWARFVRMLARSPCDPGERERGEVDRLWDSLPAGIFKMDAFEQFFFDFLTRRSIPKSFDEMPRQLMLVANDLDQGQRVVFGTEGDMPTCPSPKR